MTKGNSKKLDFILAVVIIGIVLVTRVYDANRQKITAFFDGLKHPEVVTITDCFVENDLVKISAFSNGKYRDSNPKKEDNAFYLLEYEPFEDGSESKRYISFAPKTIDLSFEVPLKFEDSDPRRYYGDRKYNRFGVCVWDGDKYVLVSNLFYIEDKKNEYEPFEELNVNQDDINVFILNPYDRNKRKLIKEDASIRNYYKFYVPNVYEREGFNMINQALDKIYKKVRLEHPYNNINWFLGVNVNKQIYNYLAKNDVKEYSKNYYRALRSFYTFIDNAKIDVKIDYPQNIDFVKVKEAKDNVCVLIDPSIDSDEMDTSFLNYDANDFLDKMKTTSKLFGSCPIFYSNKEKVSGDEFNINEYVDETADNNK